MTQAPHIDDLLALLDERCGFVQSKMAEHSPSSDPFFLFKLPFAILWPMFVRVVSKIDLSDEDKKFIWDQTNRLTEIPPRLTNGEAAQILKDILVICLKAEDGREQG